MKSRAMIFVSLDLGVVRHISDRVAVMNDGFVVEEGDVEQVFTAPTRPYTMASLRAQPRVPTIAGPQSARRDGSINQPRRET
ncbi:MAG: hypothetical protein P0Y65_12160 [Candidatus Devosia phytovorans]|uniref:Oligopeptide/dipeptide ABC transporter C-terminal domain-containing protein n=1 Tax=Candidatus Devosia phytovorans TaxID=3121372 RepID=A0AAJ6AYP8_9HYPH|nr:hypothetical protein [Devosia sp.]WEK02961.1 MAG: hypothetical protein P0Y65_12160 [Devosia sp.]